jgi:phosphoribosylformylglycinamidine (FGAM) synthase-like amidotransferase family enzyme
LLRNANQQFICKNTYLKGIGSPDNALKIPVAHGEGRYYADEHILDELENNQQVIYRYCDQSGTSKKVLIQMGPCEILQAYVTPREMYLE